MWCNGTEDDSIFEQVSAKLHSKTIVSNSENGEDILANKQLLKVSKNYYKSEN